MKNNIVIKESRYLYRSNFLALCEEHNWFTKKGGEIALKHLFPVKNGFLCTSTKNLTTNKLKKIAQAVIEYSEPETTEILGLGGVMYCINNVCRICFEEQ